jgi:hypothetical protein
MNEIKLSGTVFNAKQNGKLTTFRLSFYNGKNKSGEFNPNGFIDCKCFDAVEFKDKEKVEVIGYLACDYWEYQGKKYSQLTIKVNEINRNSKPKADAWIEESLHTVDEIPF